MAKTGYQLTYVIRDAGADLSDLLREHQKVFPGNQLAVWRKGDKVIVKVSNYINIAGFTFAEAAQKIGYVEPRGN